MMRDMSPCACFVQLGVLSLVDIDWSILLVSATGFIRACRRHNTRGCFANHIPDVGAVDAEVSPTIKNRERTQSSRCSRADHHLLTNILPHQGAGEIQRVSGVQQEPA